MRIGCVRDGDGGDGFGWRLVLDLGDLTAARSMEMYVLLWLRLFSAAGTPMVNVRVVT